MNQNNYYVTLTDLNKISKKSLEIQTMLSQHGFCVVQGLDNTKDSILGLSQYLGDIQFHIRADSDGVVGEESVDVSWKDHIGEYKGVGQGEFFPHTDGSFLAV